MNFKNPRLFVPFLLSPALGRIFSRGITNLLAQNIKTSLIILFAVSLSLTPILVFSQETLSKQLSVSDIKVLQKATEKGELAKFEITLQSKTEFSASYSDFNLNVKLLDNQNEVCAETSSPIGFFSSQSSAPSVFLSSNRVSLSLNKDCPLPQTVKVSFLKKGALVTSSSLEIPEEKSKQEAPEHSLILSLIVLILLAASAVYLLKIKKINKI